MSVTHSNFEIKCLRKELMKSDVNSAFHHLCKPTCVVTEWLFGDDLGKTVKDIQDERKATAGVVNQTNNSAGIRFRPYPSSRPYRSSFKQKLQAKAAG